MLGTSYYGIISLYTTCVTIITIVFGLQTVGTFAIARNEYDDKDQNNYQSACMGLTIVSFLVMSCIVITIKPLIHTLDSINNILFVCAIIHSFGSYCVTILNTKFTYEYKATQNMILSFFTTISISVLSIILIYIWPNENIYYGRILGYVIVYIIAAIGIPIYFFRIGKVFYNKNYWKFCLGLSIPIVFHNLSSVIMGHCDILMLRALMGYKIVGIYSLAASFCGILEAVQSALNHSWIPFYFDFLKIGDHDKLKCHANNYIILFTGITFGFLLLATPVYYIYASKEYWDGIQLILMFVLGYYFSFLYTFPANFEFFSKNTKVVAISTFASALINVFLNYLFIKKMGSFGAVFATAIANIFLFVFHHLAASRIIKIEKYPFRLKFFLPYIIAVLLFSVLYHFIKENIILCVGLAVFDGGFLVLKMVKNKSIF